MREARLLAILAGRAARRWWEDNALRLSASLAFYALFSTAPAVLLMLTIAGAVFGDEAAEGHLVGQLHDLVGPRAARLLEQVIANASEAPSSASVMGTLLLVVAATGVFAELQSALNLIWRVRPRPGYLVPLLKARLLGFALVQVLGLLMFLSFILSAGIRTLGRILEQWLPGIPVGLWDLLDMTATWLVVCAVYASIYRVLPDVSLAWRDVVPGALAAGLLSVLLRLGLRAYLGVSSFGSSYGAAGSLVVFLLWVWLSSCILLYGAEFTEVFTRRDGARARVAHHAESLDPSEVAPD